MTGTSGKPPSSAFEGDFAPGEVVIGRYRVVALVGEGGMGQVYLADDLVLGQPVALKFLPEDVARREGGLERFRAEVRHAREVTHPNVARVHDIGEVDGRHFLTMEFVDGEDLASLVRRIGRLPSEKAAEIAQQICAGLAEAHARGVLHRDLKPANVMLDGEGQVKLTDFGLAVATDGADGGVLAGTPQYMAPEQLSGLPASERSEVYALGLVLYELYTGKRALRGHTLDELRREHEERGVAPPSSVLEAIDPAVDAVLARCLERDPAQRPQSVREVARALPGGDPLAAALAAGETPAPELVAAAATRGALGPRVGLALYAGCLALIVAALLGHSALLARDGLSYGKPEAVLVERARELAHALARPADERVFAHEAHWYAWDESHDDHPSRDTARATPLDDVSRLLHHSRFDARPLIPSGIRVSIHDPVPAPGSARVTLDAEGRLLAWSYLPEPSSRPVEGDGEDTLVPDEAWAKLIAAAGLDPEALRPAEPVEDPPVFATERRAWEPPDAEPGYTVHAAGLRGTPVHFGLTRDDHPLGGSPSGRQGSEYPYILLGLTALAALLAWRNVRAGRADLPGALAVGLFALGTHLVLIVGSPGANEVSSLGWPLLDVASMSVHTAVRVLLLYLALEPFARRRWPTSLVAWSRLLKGRVRDPSVGRELLVGLFAGCTLVTAIRLVRWSLDVTGVQEGSDAFFPTAGLGDPLSLLCHFLHAMGDVVMFAGLTTFVFVLLRAIVRHAVLGNVLWIALPLALVLIADPRDYGGMAETVLRHSVFLVLLSRFGFLAVIGNMAAAITLTSLPLTLRPSDWNATSSALVVVALVALITWAYRTAVAGRSTFQGAREAATAR